ncbi:hypothetical protein Hanom_Chr15g01361881 [Helianthus anomalus]
MLCGSPFAFNMLQVVPKIVYFLLSTTPFCCGVYGAGNCFAIPFCLQKSRNTFEVNLPPLSVLNALTFLRYLFSSPVSYSIKSLGTWSLVLITSALPTYSD